MLKKLITKHSVSSKQNEKMYTHVEFFFFQALGKHFLFHLIFMKPYELGMSVIPFIKELGK